MGTAQSVVMVTIGGYLLLISALGYYGHRSTSDEADFLVAGRNVGMIIGAGTLLASQISASTVVGAIGIHYLFGVGFAWVWFGILVGWLISLTLIAPQLRRFGGMTVPDFIGTRYADDGANGNYTRAVTAVIIVLVFTVFLTAQYTAGALIFRQLLGIPESTGVLLTAVIAVAYTATGGMRASVLTDFLQSIVIVGGLLFAVPFVVVETGGIGELVTQIYAIDPALLGQAFPVGEITGFMIASAFGIAAAPMEVSRFYAMRDEATVRSAILISLVAQFLIASSVVVLGLSARVLFPTLDSPDLAALVLSQEVFHPVFGTLLMLAFLSAILSTVDSVLLVSSAAIAHDVYTQLIRPESSERERVLLNRVAVVFAGTVPIGMAFYKELFGGLITLITLLNLSLQAAVLFVPILFGLHWRRATTAGGIGAVVAGFLTVVLWYVGTEIIVVIPIRLTRVVGDPVIPGLIVSTITMITLSLATDPPSERATAPFFSKSD
jgi:SSS family transporter